LLTFAVLVFGGCNKSEEPVEDWVDLGLPSGLLWATHNVGAAMPEEYGDYFAWGETQPKNDYENVTYKYIVYLPQEPYGGYGPYYLTKYCNDDWYGYGGYVDQLNVLLPSDDAATVNLGDGARIPTKEEWEELCQNTKSEWTTQRGVRGRCFIGQNGNKLFLPECGFRYSNHDVYVGHNGYYWSRSLYLSSPVIAWALFFDSDGA